MLICELSGCGYQISLGLVIIRVFALHIPDRKRLHIGLRGCDTPLGKELDVDLFQVFMGVWYEWEVPMILENYHLIDEAEADALYVA